MSVTRRSHWVGLASGVSLAQAIAAGIRGAVADRKLAVSLGCSEESVQRYMDGSSAKGPSVIKKQTE